MRRGVRRAGPGVLALWCGLGAAGPVAGQDSVPPVEQGVRLGITYTPGMRPGLLVLGGPSEAVLDSVRTILRRDLDHSDRFELISLPSGDSLILGLSDLGTGAGGLATAGFVNYGLYAALGAEYSVAVLPGQGAGPPVVTVYDVRGESVRSRIPIVVTDVRDREFRMAVHRAADDVVRAATGLPGIAASRVLFVQGDRLYGIDADGAGLTGLSPAGEKTFSPAWDPTGRRLAYAVLAGGAGRVYLQDAASGRRTLVAPTGTALNWTAALSPDGRGIAFARAGEEGTDIYTYNVGQDCCLQRLTVGRFSDNLSPTFSPDGRRIAFVSTRAGLPQIYVMSADGTGQELFAPFDYGVTGSSQAPEWSPDGTQLAFHRDVAGSPQVFIMNVRSRDVRQLTSAGRNEDPTWAPDSRHIAFVSNRTGTRQVWVIDIETGRVRQLTSAGGTRLPAWSPRIPEVTNP